MFLLKATQLCARQSALRASPSSASRVITSLKQQNVASAPCFVRIQPLSSTAARLASPKSMKEEHYRKKDKVPLDFRLVYRAPMEHYLADVVIPERPKLRFMDKVPILPSNMKAPKLQKKLKFMRGPETVHNSLLHKQYGIVATGGGRLRWGHFEMIRLGIGRKMDVSRMFAAWRVDAPWQPITKKGQGQRMGGGKSAIDHYVTPVKSGRVIVEMAGKCEFAEVKPILETVCHKLPFKAMVVSHEMLEEMKAEGEQLERDNLNEYSLKYIIQNNMGGCHRWLSPVDHKWFGKYH